MKKQLLLFAIMLMPLVACADTVEINGIWYNLFSETNKAEVTCNPDNQTKYSGSVVIPSSVTYGGTEYSVTSIGNIAFYGCSSMTYVTIPNSVKSIGERAFESCTSLTSVIIPNSVKNIKSKAFYDCIALTSIHISDISVWCKIQFGSGANPLFYAHHLYLNNEEVTNLVIPNGVTDIGAYAFSGCTGLTSVTIPSNVTSIGGSAFEDCSGLTSVTIGNSVTEIGTAAFSGCTNMMSVTIGNSVGDIGDNAFYSCASLTSVILPNSVKRIGNSAFSGCSNLASLTIGSRVTFMGENVFSGCTSLTSVAIPNSVTVIGVGAFEGCTSLTSVAIPNSVTFIGGGTFRGCTSLTSVTIGNSVTSIDDWAFGGCTSLTSVTIGNSVTSIGNIAFYGCSSMTYVKVESGNTKYDSRENCNAIIETASNTLILGCKNTVIPSNVTSIGDHAFYGCTGLTAITIPNSVTNIGVGAFGGCTGLTFVTIPNSVTSIGEAAFANCSDLTSVTLNSNAIVSKTYKTYDTPSNLRNYFGNQVAEYIIGDNVTSIGSSAFSGCSDLTSVTIGNSVTSIGGWAFYKCSSLASVTIPNSVTSIGSNAFCGVDLPIVISLIENPFAITGKASNSRIFSQNTFNNATLYVPVGTIEKYKATGGWKDFAFIEESSTPPISPDDNPGDQTDNVLTLGNVKGNKNSQVILPVALTNKHQIVGLQMDLYLPEGVTVATNSKGKMLISTTDRMDGSYSISSNVIDNYVRIVGYSADGDAFSGESGDILNITLNIGNITDGDYTVRLKDIVLSDVNNTEYHPVDVGSVITVKSYTLGDVDNSGAININDVVCIINYILNKTNGTFIEEAADVDGSGTININDVVTLINRYILNKTSAKAFAIGSDVQDAADIIANNNLHLATINIAPGETKEVEMLMTNANNVSAAQGNIKLPQGISFVLNSKGKVDAKNIDARSEDFTLSCAIQSDGSLTFAHYSADGYTYDGNEGGIFKFKIKADENATAGSYDIDLSGIVLSIDGVGYDIPNRSSSLIITGTDGISSIESNVTLPNGDYFTLDGMKIDNTPKKKGIYIVNGKKVVVK